MTESIWEVGEPEDRVEGLRPDGSPDPQYAKALGIVQATIKQRVIASAIDFGGLILLQIPSFFLVWPLVIKLLRDQISWFGFTNHPNFVFAMIVLGATVGLSVIYCLTQILFNGARGLTLGKGIVGVRNVNVATLGKPKSGRAFLRALVIWAPAVVVIGPVLVLMSPLWDSTRRNRGWADLAGRTWLIDINAGLNPYDDKRMRIARKTLSAPPITPRPGLASLTVTEAGPVYRPEGRISAGVLAATSAGELRGKPAGQRARTPLIPPSYVAPAAPTNRTPTQQASAPTSAPHAPSTPQAPLAPHAPRTSRRAAQPPPWLVLDTGEQIELSSAVIVGRGPVVTPDLVGATPIAIDDATYSVSKTHFVIRSAGDHLEVTDQGSTNGTFVTSASAPGAPEVSLPVGQPYSVAIGDTIRFGERTLTIQRATQEPA